jgi:hypothetical protein
MTEKLGASRAVLAVVLAGAIVTYGGVSLFVALFVLGPYKVGVPRGWRELKTYVSAGQWRRLEGRRLLIGSH